VNIAVLLDGFSVTTPFTAAPPVAVSVIVDVVIVEAVIASLNTMTTGVVTATPAARLGGDTDDTDGAVSSRTVKPNENGAAIAFPAASRTAVVTVTAINVELGSAAAGAKEAVRVAGL